MHVCYAMPSACSRELLLYVHFAQGSVRECRNDGVRRFAAAGCAAAGRVIVGVDAEWRPRLSRCASQQSQWPVSVLQIATRTAVFLVDLLALFAEWRQAPSAVHASLVDSVQWLFTRYERRFTKVPAVDSDASE